MLVERVSNLLAQRLGGNGLSLTLHKNTVCIMDLRFERMNLFNLRCKVLQTLINVIVNTGDAVSDLLYTCDVLRCGLRVRGRS